MVEARPVRSGFVAQREDVGVFAAGTGRIRDIARQKPAAGNDGQPVAREGPAAPRLSS